MQVIEFRYRQERGPLGPVLRPIASIFLEAPPHTLEAIMYIDSGADITTLPLGAGIALGFKQDPKSTLLEMRGVSGGSVPYIIKPVHLVFDNIKIKAHVAWALIEEVPFLLGRRDIFTRFDITFQERKGRILFNHID